MRQRNVQQQNTEAEMAMHRHASYWRSAALPPALLKAAAAHGVDCSQAIFLQLEMEGWGMQCVEGLLLTCDERFIDFEIATDESYCTIECIEQWRDVTHAQNLGLHNRGTGVGQGALALKVLRAINGAGHAGAVLP